MSSSNVDGIDLSILFIFKNRKTLIFMFFYLLDTKIKYSQSFFNIQLQAFP